VYKIVRPGVVEEVQHLRSVIGAVSTLLRNAGRGGYACLVECYIEDLEGQTDMMREAAAMRRARAELYNDHFKIPEPYHATARVLTMEYVPGLLREEAQESRHVSVSAFSYLESAFLRGALVHTDLHPGNLAVADGAIVLYDWGSAYVAGDVGRTLYLAWLQEDISMAASALFTPRIASAEGNFDKSGDFAMELMRLCMSRLNEGYEVNRDVLHLLHGISHMQEMFKGIEYVAISRRDVGLSARVVALARIQAFYAESSSDGEIPPHILDAARACGMCDMGADALQQVERVLAERLDDYWRPRLRASLADLLSKLY
jgi:hypothetical protein